MIRQEWYKPGELLGRHGLPTTHAGLWTKANKERWITRPAGRGKGREFHLSSLPPDVQNALTAAHDEHLKVEAVHLLHTPKRDDRSVGYFPPEAFPPVPTIPPVPPGPIPAPPRLTPQAERHAILVALHQHHKEEAELLDRLILLSQTEGV